MSGLVPLAVALVCAAPAPAPATTGSPVRISGVHFDGFLPGSPEPDSAVRLINTDDKRAVDVGGYVLTEKFSPAAAGARAGLDRDADDEGMDADPDDPRRPKVARGNQTLRLAEGLRIPAGGEIWIAASAAGFRQVFGTAPACEASDAGEGDPDVPNCAGGFPRLPSDYGTLALTDDAGAVVDFVAYENSKDGVLGDSFGGAPWIGPPVRLKGTSFYGWRGQILARDRDEAGHILKDTDRADDWDSGFSRKVLGEEPTHRIEVAGQSRFVSRPLRGVRARVLATSAPDNNYQALVDAFDGAKRSIRVRIYELTNPKIVEALIKAKRRGVDVTLFLEGSPVGGIADQERWLVDRAARAGIPVYFLATPKKSKLKPRYRFDHSKYVIIDDAKVIIGSENYGRTGVPVFPSYGNRGWMLHIEEPSFVRQLRAVWDADFRPPGKDGTGGMPDVLSIDASPTDSYGMPYRDPGFTPDETLRRGLYESPKAPVVVDDKMDLELVLSPDTSLNEHSAIIGLIERAKKTLYVEQNSIRKRWGKKDGSSDPDVEEGDDTFTTPNLALQAVVAAARRGVAVRVLLDSTWYNVQGDEDRDNDDTVVALNALARREGLDIAAKVINLETTHLEKIHTKGIIVDDREVFVGSINWTENSFKGNREVGVVVSHPKVAGYYAELFRRDWSRSRIYEAPVVAPKAEVHAAPDAKSKVVMRLGSGDRVFVVGEHGKPAAETGGKPALAPAWIEVSLGVGKELGVTGFVDPKALGVPEATPGEALHVIGREAVIVGRVAATNVSERRIQLRFADELRPPFTAVIFKKDEPDFTKKGLVPAQAFQGHEVRVRGRVTTYRGPEILIDDPEQIEILR